MSQITMPQLGESVTEGTILKWLKKEGDRIEVDESLCEIETEKVTTELPSPVAGVVGKILVAEGDTVEVGVPLCEIAVEGETAAPTAEPASVGAASDGAAAEATPAAESAPTPAPAPAPAQPASTPEPAAAGPRRGWAPGEIRGNGTAGDRSTHYSPAVLRLAGEHSVDLAQVKGSGVGGRVTRKDVQAFIDSGVVSPAAPQQPAAAQPATAPAQPVAAPAREGDELRKLSPTRRTIGDRMRQSILEQPQAWIDDRGRCHEAGPVAPNS